MKRLIATYTRDEGGLHAELKDVETQEIMHTITARQFRMEALPRFVKEVKSWAARNDALIVEETFNPLDGAAAV